MKSVLVVCLVLSLVAVGRSSTTSDGYPYPGSINCYLECILPCTDSVMKCALCVGRCLMKAESSPMDSIHRDPNYFCKLGCSASLCTKFLTAKNPDEKIKVKGCVNSCSQTCTNTMN